ncbi:hypothetical protein LCM4573_24810 [Rhizobium sp. LCM 4573]|nr:hypothetical protein LCM4573_24810 [Rhizobium sp. LCM 4573]
MQVVSDNIIKFQKPKPPEQSRQVPSWLKRLLVVLAIMAAFAAAYIYFALTGTPAQAAGFQRCGAVKRDCVVDGDTLYVGADKVRVADIDTPEVSQPQCAEEKALGDRATARFVELVNGGPFEMQTWEGRDEDQYGRKLRVLIRDGRSLGDVLVEEGLARTWSGRREPWC